MKINPVVHDIIFLAGVVAIGKAVIRGIKTPEFKSFIKKLTEKPVVVKTEEVKEASDGQTA